MRLDVTIMNGIKLLESIADELGCPVFPCVDYDPNVCSLRARGPHNPAELEAVRGLPFKRSLSFRKEGHRIRIKANEQCVVLIVLSDLNISPIGVNAPNRIFPMQRVKKRLGTRNETPIYTESGELDFEQQQLLANGDLVRLVEKLGEKECMLVSRSDIRIYTPSSSLGRVLEFLEIGINIVKARQLPRSHANTSGLPSEFQDLAPLVESFGKTDDEARQAIRDVSSRAALRAVVEQVRPRLTAINRYLDSFGTRPLSDAAISLQALAEFVVETELHLNSSRS